MFIPKRILAMCAAALLTIGVLNISSCGRFERGVAKVTGHAEQCIDGVKYLQFTSGASVKYRQDGTIWTC